MEPYKHATRYIPYPISIPSTAYLVVGSCPIEDSKGRTFYTKENYYLYDNKDISEERDVDRSRYIEGNFTEFPVNSQLGKVFKEQFDTVIFDNSVAKYLNGNAYPLKSLFMMVKPGGNLIIDSVNGLSVINPIKIFDSSGIGREESLEESKDRVKKAFIWGIVDNLTEIGKLQFKTFNEIIENPVAKEVYGPLLSNEKLLKEKYISPDGECILITKSKAGSGGKRSIRKNKKRMSTRKIRSTERSRK
jgi:hypothetical protein